MVSLSLPAGFVEVEAGRGPTRSGEPRRTPRTAAVASGVPVRRATAAERSRQALWKWNADEAYAKWGTRTRCFVGVWGACRRAYGGELPRQGLWKWKPDEVLREVERGRWRSQTWSVQNGRPAPRPATVSACTFGERSKADSQRTRRVVVSHFRGAVSHFRLGVVSLPACSGRGALWHVWGCL